MNTSLWIAQLILGGVFLATGSMKLLLTREQIVAVMGNWPEQFSRWFIKLIAAAEVFGALGLVIPWWLRIASWLTPVAAFGLSAIMCGAIMTHVKRGEYPNAALSMAIMAATVFVAVGRLGWF